MKVQSQSPFGFWGDWNYCLGGRLRDGCGWSQSPFGFWGDWNYIERKEGK